MRKHTLYLLLAGWGLLAGVVLRTTKARCRPPISRPWRSKCRKPWPRSSTVVHDAAARHHGHPHHQRRPGRIPRSLPTNGAVSARTTAQGLGGDFARHDARVPRSDGPADLLERLPCSCWTVTDAAHDLGGPVQVDAHGRPDGPIQRRACGGLHPGRTPPRTLGLIMHPQLARDLFGRGAGRPSKRS